MKPIIIGIILFVVVCGIIPIVYYYTSIQPISADVTFKIKAGGQYVLTIYNELKMKGGGHFYPSRLFTGSTEITFTLGTGRQEYYVFILLETYDPQFISIYNETTAHVECHQRLQLIQRGTFDAQPGAIVTIDLQ